MGYGKDLLGHHAPPALEATLKSAKVDGAETAPREVLQSLKGFLGCKVRLLLQPGENLRPHALEGVDPGPPGPCRTGLLPMGRPRFALLSEVRQGGEEFVRVRGESGLSRRHLLRVCKSGELLLRVAHHLQQVNRIKVGSLLSEH